MNDDNTAGPIAYELLEMIESLHARARDAEIRIENALAALAPGVRADPDRIIRILTGQE